MAVLNPVEPSQKDGVGGEALAGWIAMAFILMLAMVLAGPLMTGGDDFSGGGNPARQAGYLFVFGMLVVSTSRANGLEKALRTSPPCNVLLAFCWLSLIWAIDPTVGMRRLILTTIVVYSVFIVARTLGTAASLALLRRVLVIVLFVNFIFVAALPGVGIHQFAPNADPGLVGDWRGIHGEKNLAGSIAAVTILILILDPRSRLNMAGLGLIAAAGFFLFQTGSRTALGICVLALAGGLAFRRYDWRFWPLATMGSVLAAACLALLITAHWSDVTSIIDRQDAFTGRPLIWAALLGYVRDHGALGSGYGSFWNIGSDSPIYTYAKQGTWLTTRIATAHNGYLDLTVQIGVPGLLFALFALLVHPAGRLLTNPSLGDHRPVLAAVFLFCLGQNLTESTMFDRDYFVQVCLMWSIAGILCHGPGRGPASPHGEARTGQRTATHSEASKARNGAGTQSDGSP